MSTISQEEARYVCIPLIQGPLHLHVNYVDNKITKVFANLPPIGTDISSMTQLIGILITKYIETGGDPKNLLKHLRSIKSGAVSYWEEQQIDSIPHAIAIAMEGVLNMLGGGDNGNKVEDRGADKTETV